jgi:hypothetical protein
MAPGRCDGVDGAVGVLADRVAHDDRDEGEAERARGGDAVKADDELEG